MVAESSLDFPKLTREAAADPRTFTTLAEIVTNESVKGLSKIAPLDAGRILEVLEAVCLDLTRRQLCQANRLEASPVETLRKAMVKGEEEVRAVSLSMAQIDIHWKRVQAEFGDKAPVAPPGKHYVVPDEAADQRLLKKAEGFLDYLIGIVNDMMGDPDAALNAKRKFEQLRGACLTLTGQELGDVADRWTNPLRRFRGPLQTPAAELLELRRAYYAIPEVTASERAHWDEIIQATMNLQRQARHDPAKFMAYVFRDADPSRAGEVLTLEWFHVSWFGVWLDPIHPHSLIMAPPGHGKSFCVCAMDIWEVARMPELRFLALTDTAEKVPDDILRIEGIMQGDLFRAVFPEIRIMDRVQVIEEDKKPSRGQSRRGKRHTKTQRGFTVFRKNDLFSKEPTFYGASTLGNINGRGFDRIRPDDWFPPQVREEPTNRVRYCKRFFGVVQERLRDSREARIRAICTAWHPEDPAGCIRKAASSGKLPTWRVQIEPYAIKDGPDGKAIPLWAAKKDSAALEERKFTLGHDYNCVYRLQASEPAQRPVTEIHWYNARPAEQAAAPDTPDTDRALWDDLARAHRTLSIDPAGSDARTACDTGAIDGRLVRVPEEDGYYGFVANVWLLHLSSPQLLDWIVAEIMRAWQEERHPYTELMIESAGAMKGQVNLYEDWLPKEFERIGLPENVRPSILTPGVRTGEGQTGQNRGKMRRFREASPYIQRGSIRFAGRRAWMKDIDGHGLWRLEPIPNSPMQVLATLLLEFDGTTRFDAGDAVTQWILYNKNRLRDPFARRRVELGPRPVYRGPFATAFASVMQKMMAPQNEHVTPDDAIRKTYGKYELAGAMRSS